MFLCMSLDAILIYKYFYTAMYLRTLRCIETVYYLARDVIFVDVLITFEILNVTKKNLRNVL